MKSGFVSFVGRPNAGKSTLLNRLVGSKLAIVSDKPQTTRNRILGVRNYEGAQVVFLDTPGIHRPLHRMNVRMMDTALEAIREVDVLCLVVDAAEPMGKGDRFVLELIKDARVPVFLVLNKIDLVRKSRLLPIIDQFQQSADFAEIVPVSAMTGDNIDRLEKAIIDRLPEGEALYPEDYLTDQPERFLAGEIVREKLLQLTRDEIPFSSAVMIDRFEEPVGPKGILRLYATIVVERESQKPIVIGKGGAMIKQIGIAAREELEQFFAAKVFLDLHVKVKSDWREDDHMLQDIGVGGAPGGTKPRRLSYSFPPAGMPLHATDALILRTYSLGESDRIVVFLTRDRGKKRGVAKNARQSRRRFGGALEPMTHGRVRYRERERRDLVFLEEVVPIRSPLSVANGDALGYVGYFAELIDEWAQDNDSNEPLFRLGTSAVEAMAAGVPIDPLARYFEFWLLRLQGVYREDPKASSEARAFLEAARSCSPFRLGDIPASPKMLLELERLHREQIALHLEKDLRSIRVLRDMRR